MLLPLSFRSPRRELLTWLVRKGGSSKEGEGSGIIAELLFQSRERAGGSEEQGASTQIQQGTATSLSHR